MSRLARLYGGSLYDLAAQEGMGETMMEQMEQIRVLFWENPDYVRLLSLPAIPLSERKALIESAFGHQAEPYLVNFLKLLCDRRILREYPGCCDEFARRYNRDHGIAPATVTSAVPLREEQMEALRQKLEKISNKTVCLKQILDPSVLGGLRVELEGKRLDGTVKGRLEGVSEKLNEIKDGMETCS